METPRVPFALKAFFETRLNDLVHSLSENDEAFKAALTKRDSTHRTSHNAYGNAVTAYETELVRVKQLALDVFKSSFDNYDASEQKVTQEGFDGFVDIFIQQEQKKIGQQQLCLS